MVFVQDVVIIPNSILEDAEGIIGRKAATRSILQQLKLPTPKAFVVTESAFYTFLNYQNGLNKWRNLLDNAHAFSPENMVSVSRELQKLVRSHPLDPKLAEAITSTYKKVLHNHWAHLTISPTPTTQSPVNLPLPIIKGDTALLDFLRQIWSAQLTPHSLSLQLASQSRLIQVSPVMVSQHEEAITSGTITTIDPLTQNKNLIQIEAIFGTNPQTDQKSLPGDKYIVDKNTKVVISRQLQPQESAIVADYFGHYKPKKIAKNLQYNPKLNTDQILELTQAGLKIHSHQVSPQIINWLITKSGLYLTRFHQFEPQPKSSPNYSASPKLQPDKKIDQIATGLIASPGIATAPLIRPSSNNQSFTGRIVLISQPDPNLINRMKHASGILIESGGITSEISLAARDIGIPTLVGTGKIQLKDSTVVTLDAIKGTVYINKTSPSLTSPSLSKNTQPPTTSNRIATKIYLSLNQLSDQLVSAYQHADGVGELKGNDLVLAMGIHPKRIIDRHYPAFEADFETKLTAISHLFGDRPVYYHPIDLDSATAKKLEHGHVYEPITESNTHLGFRGAYRAMSDPGVFTTEIKLLAKLRHKRNLRNLCLCLPLVRSVKEFTKLKLILSDQGLHQSPTFKIAIKVGTASSLDFIPQLAKEGLDAIMIDLDHLTATLTGYDPTSAEVDQEINPNHPVVLQTLNSILKACDLSRLKHFISSYSLSQSSETVSNVIRSGASHLIITAPQFNQVVSWVSQAEKRLITK